MSMKLIPLRFNVAIQHVQSGIYAEAAQTRQHGHWFPGAR